jgi:hypothetical protein
VMIIMRLNLILFVFLSCLPCYLWAANFCPLQIQTEQSIVPPKGWHLYKSIQPNRLKGAGFSVGSPSKGLTRKPQYSKENQFVLEKYFFGGSVDIWISCGYSNTSLALEKSIGKPKACTVQTNNLTGHVAIDCRY